MRISLPLLALSLAFLAMSLSAQNLVFNGDFEGGTKPNGDPNGWTVSGFTFNPMVSKHNTTGGSVTNCYNHHPGGKTSPNTAVNAIEQEMVFIQGVVHEFRADIASTNSSSNGDGGTVEVFVDGVSVGKHAFGFISGGTIERTRLCIRVVPKATGKKKLRITFHRRFIALSGTPLVLIDNIFLGRTQGPTLCFPGERKAGSSVQIQARGNPGDKFAIFIGVGPAKPSLPIPGWTGQWELASPYVPLVLANLDGTGQWYLAAPVPLSARGAKAWLQGAQANPKSTVVHLGHAQEVNVY
ncbi:MAG: hypothetical protein ACYTKC_04155 [Planctomycetota bacterium]|jgi:hypothetical protein